VIPDKSLISIGHVLKETEHIGGAVLVLSGHKLLVKVTVSRFGYRVIFAHMVGFEGNGMKYNSGNITVKVKRNLVCRRIWN